MLTKQLPVSALAAGALVLVVSGNVSAGVGPLSEYYLVSGDEDRIDVLQGGNINLTWTVAYGFEYPVAVASTIRTTGGNENGLGGEYTLAGVPTGNSYVNPGFEAFDSTTDGKNNYIIDWGGTGVYKTNADYSNPTFMFDLGPAFVWLGITYDPTNNSLWLSAFTGGDVMNVDMAGNVLSFFNTGIGEQAALALDHADGSLWLVERSLNGDFFQYDKSGNLVSTAHYDGLVGVNPLGGEFRIGDPPSCPWDLDGDEVVGTGDLIVLLGSWGDPYGTADLIELLGNWGPCPK